MCDTSSSPASRFFGTRNGASDRLHLRRAAAVHRQGERLVPVVLPLQPFEPLAGDPLQPQVGRATGTRAAAASAPSCRGSRPPTSRGPRPRPSGCASVPPRSAALRASRYFFSRTRPCSRPSGTRPAARRAAWWRTRPGCGSSRGSGPGRTCGRGSGRTGACARGTPARRRRSRRRGTAAGRPSRTSMPVSSHGPIRRNPTATSISGSSGSISSPAICSRTNRSYGLSALKLADDVVAVPPGAAALVVVGEPGRVGVAGRRRASAGPSARRSAGDASSRSTTFANARRPGRGRSTKASISCGVGGRPVRSNVARRMSVRRSAGGAGFSPSASSRAPMKASIGFAAPRPSAPPACAAAGTPRGLRACRSGSSSPGTARRWSSPSRRRASRPSRSPRSAASDGHGAPPSIHSRIAFTSASESLSFSFGGIAAKSASVRVTAL